PDRQPLPHELRGRAEARRDPGAGGIGEQAAHRASKGRAEERRCAARGPPPAGPVRGAVAGTHRPHGRPHHRTRTHEGDPEMTVTAVEKDATALTMTVTAEFEPTPQRVWELWADPRQLERWWGPPSYPATVDSHDLRPGGKVEYQMTGPGGDQPRGYWEVDEVQPPHRLTFHDGFANDDGTPNPDLPGTS